MRVPLFLFRETIADHPDAAFSESWLSDSRVRDAWKLGANAGFRVKTLDPVVALRDQGIPSVLYLRNKSLKIAANANTQLHRIVTYMLAVLHGNLWKSKFCFRVCACLCVNLRDFLFWTSISIRFTFLTCFRFHIDSQIKNWWCFFSAERYPDFQVYNSSDFLGVCFVNACVRVYPQDVILMVMPFLWLAIRFEIGEGGAWAGDQANCRFTELNVWFCLPVTTKTVMFMFKPWKLILGELSFSSIYFVNFRFVFLFLCFSNFSFLKYFSWKMSFLR